MVQVHLQTAGAGLQSSMHYAGHARKTLGGFAESSLIFYQTYNAS